MRGAKALSGSLRARGSRDSIDKRPAPDLQVRLANVIGLEPIKEQIRSLKDTLIKLRFRKEVGAPLVDLGPQHMLFTGNPGCGKTSVARLVAQLLYDLGAVTSDVFVEVQRTDLVGTHIGQTGPKTRAKIEDAKGGVLFVDEAYRLTSTSDKDFGAEALEEIMSTMNEPGAPVIIAAGYPREMANFLAANEGLQRRFGHTFAFPDFTVGELATMFQQKVAAKGFRLDDDVTRERVSQLIAAHTDAEFRGKLNGGVAERLSRGAMRAQDSRLEPTESFSAMTRSGYRESASTLSMADVERAAAELMTGYNLLHA